MIETLLLCYIVCHGFFDVLMFKNKLKSSIIYILLGFTNIIMWYICPSLILIYLILHTYHHFNSDIHDIYPSNKLYLASSMFMGTMIGYNNIHYWCNTIRHMGIWEFEIYLVIVAIHSLNCYMLYVSNHIKLDIMALLYGAILGPYYGIFIYMIFHSSLTLYKTIYYHYPNTINSNINKNPKNIWYLIILSIIINYIIAYSNILLMLNKQFIVDITIYILLSHVYLHNFLVLDDINPY